MKIIAAGISAILILYVCSCSDCRDAQKMESPPLKSKQKYAEKFVELYTFEEFTANLSAHISSVLGQDVVEQAKGILREKITPAQARKKRISFLKKTFSSEELKFLIGAYSSRAGRSAIKKLPAYNKLWEEFLTPSLIEALSNRKSPKEAHDSSLKQQ